MLLTRKISDLLIKNTQRQPHGTSEFEQVKALGAFSFDTLLPLEGNLVPDINNLDVP